MSGYELVHDLVHELADLHTVVVLVEPWTISDIAAHLGVSTGYVRRRKSEDPGYLPEPSWKAGHSPVWEADLVRRHVAARTARRVE